MKRKWMLLPLCLLLLSGCGREGDSEMESATFAQITAEEANSMMDGQEDYILLDVRSEEEYQDGHIEGAILIPDSEIMDRAKEELPDKDATILVYCRSGRRSKAAAQELADLGYTGIYEFGGIIDWPYPERVE